MTARLDGRRLAILIAVTLFVWLAIAAVCTLSGSTRGFGHLTPEIARWRLQRNVLPASMIGAALAAAGVAYQAVLRNPLADPYLLGVSSGATLASYVWRLPLATAVPLLAGSSPHAIAMLGAALAVGVVLFASRRHGRVDPVTAVLAGVIVNALCGSLFMLLNAIFRDAPGGGGMLTFLVGDLQPSVSVRDLVASATIIVLGFTCLIPLSARLNAVRLGEDEAASLGVRVHRVRWITLTVASLMTAAAVAISGPIGFVGLICPHLARYFVGNDNRRLLIVSAGAGASALALADLLARHLLANDRLGVLVPVGVITALAGAPFFLVVLTRGRK